MTVRGDLLNDARLAVEGDRNKDYGSAEANFGRTAALWNAWCREYEEEERTADFVPFQPSDVAVFMILVKVARLAESNSRDTWQDIAGYAACGYETVADVEPAFELPTRPASNVKDYLGRVWTLTSSGKWCSIDDREGRDGLSLVAHYGPLTNVRA